MLVQDPECLHSAGKRHGVRFGVEAEIMDCYWIVVQTSNKGLDLMLTVSIGIYVII